MAYTTIPSGCKLELSKFKVEHPQQQLDDFRTLLKLAPIAPETYENTSRTDGQYGVSRKWAIEKRDVWLNNYDWRKTEARINSFPNYTTPIKGPDGDTYTTHFIALFSENPDAVPVVLVHGWPGSILEFLYFLDEAKAKYPDPKEMPYHFIVPSMTGYGYSKGPSITTEWTTVSIADVVHELMVGLGFGDGYISHGGDIGSFVSRILAVKYDACKAIHLNFCLMGKPQGVNAEDVTPEETTALGRLFEFGTTGNAYAREHGTKGGTLGLVLASSPLALLCWIGEKYIAWTDQTPSDQDLLDSVMLYWLTETQPRGIFPYIDFFGRGDKSTTFHGDADWHCKKPIGYSYFPFELGPVPLAWAKTTGNIVWHRAHKSGGHFAALEKPKELFQDQEDFISGLNWKQLSGGSRSTL